MGVGEHVPLGTGLKAVRTTYYICFEKCDGFELDSKTSEGNRQRGDGWNDPDVHSTGVCITINFEERTQRQHAGTQIQTPSAAAAALCDPATPAMLDRSS
jgi:hypothetical protein